MWLGLLLDTNATLQGEGDAFSEGSVAFRIAGVAFFREVMHLGRSVMHWGEACFTGGECCIYCPRDGVHFMQRGKKLV